MTYLHLEQEPKREHSENDDDYLILYREYVSKIIMQREKILFPFTLTIVISILMTILFSYQLIIKSPDFRYIINELISHQNQLSCIDVADVIVSYEDCTETSSLIITTIALFCILGIIPITITSESFLLGGSLLRRSQKKLKLIYLTIEELNKKNNKEELYNPKIRWENLYEQYSNLNDKAGRVLFEIGERKNTIEDLRKNISDKLEISRTKEEDKEKSEILNEVQYLLGSFKETINRESRDQRGQRLWQIFNIIIIIFYIIFLSSIMTLTALFKPELKNSLIPYISIPIWALIWGALGSLSAILYRFYNITTRVKFSEEFQWLIARPIIGILMSAIAYLTAISGLVFLGSENLTLEQINENETRFIALVCFLAGFSDRVYIAIINLLVLRLGIENKDKKNKSFSIKSK